MPLFQSQDHLTAENPKRRIGITFRILLTILLTAVLASCRVRIIEDHAAKTGLSRFTAEDPDAPIDNLNDLTNEPDRNLNKLYPDSSQTEEDPDAQRKEYDENASAEIVEGTDRLIHAEGGGSGAFLTGEDTDPVMKLNENAEETALLTVITEQAEESGVSEEGKTADSFLQYYTTMLQERSRSLFECKRQFVYWETSSDHVTVHKGSPEHTLILNAGAYDVSARLLEENLTVDNGWVMRKNPGVIVKVVSGDILGSSVRSTQTAESILSELSSREGWKDIDAVRQGRVLLLSEELLNSAYLQTGAMLVLAKAANPELYEDTDPAKAIQDLIEEATGSRPEGIFFLISR